MHVLDFDEEKHNRSLIEDGIEIGIEKGIEQGISEEQYERISGMLKRGKTPEAIAEFCDYPMELIIDVQNRMKVTV